MQKVELELYEYGGIGCLSETCPYNRECANHVTAGDFRSEDGFTPLLIELHGEYFCSSYDGKLDPNRIRPWPMRHSKYGAINQKKLGIRSANNYQI